MSGEMATSSRSLNMKQLQRLLGLAAFVLLAAFAAGAWAQNDPTIDQIYQAARSGQLGRAETMIDQVIKDHPTSGKAHYVKAEIAARERKYDVARQELSTAESLSPGLKFAKPEAVQS